MKLMNILRSIKSKRHEKYLRIAENLLWIKHLQMDLKEYVDYQILYVRCRDDWGYGAREWPDFIRRTKNLVKQGC